MKKNFITLLLISLSIYSFSQNNELFNVLSIPNGAYIVKAPSTYQFVEETSSDIVAWTKEAIIDGTNTKGWSSGKDAKFPMEFVFELSEECIINKLGFNTQCEKKYAGISAKNVRVEISTTSASTSFSKVKEVELDYFDETKYFEITPLKARWVKVIILSNNGFADYTELMEIEAWGKYANSDVTKIDLTGDWESNWGLASFRQTGSGIKGCYAYHNGIIRNAGIDRRILTYEWYEESDIPVGHAVLVVNEEGTRLNGIWGFGDDLNRYGIWVFRKKGNSPTLCFQDNQSQEALKKEEVVKIENMKTEIEKKGKLIMYGINFETNSAIIKEESFSILSEIYALLSTNSSMKLNIVGHTDAIGTNDANMKLSINRAESVRKYLVVKGISSVRLVASGNGEELPIADNTTQLGKAANRRVELLLQ